MSVEVKWEGHKKFIGLNNKGKSITMDATVEAGSLGEGVTPMEVLLQAVGGCTGMDVVTTAQKMRLNIEQFSMIINGIKAEEHPRKYTEIEITYKIDGQDLDPKKLFRAINLSMEKYCSVSNSLTANIKTKLILNGEIVEQISIE